MKELEPLSNLGFEEKHSTLNVFVLWVFFWRKTLKTQKHSNLLLHTELKVLLQQHVTCKVLKLVNVVE